VFSISLWKIVARVEDKIHSSCEVEQHDNYFIVYLSIKSKLDDT
jgi:hypothetical protein